MTLAIVAGLYLLTLIIIAWISGRKGTSSAEDYFLAGRSFGTLVLFMALYGTNVTAFAMLGLPGKAYHMGVGIFGFFGASAAFWGMIVFILFGYPIWKFGKSYRFITPTQMFQSRWASPTVGYLVLILMLLYTIPYMVVGIMGGAIALNHLGGEVISYKWAAVIITLVTVFYTSLGGMRGTAWTNVFQASIFLVFLTVACIGISSKLGGAAALFDRMANEAPQLLERHGFPDGIWATGFLVGPVSIIAFPHMFMRLLAAKDARSLRRTIKLYPWALLLLFIPVTLIGVWGAVTFPGLEGKASDDILPMLVSMHLPEWLAAVGLAAILAAVMSSLDAQLLTISTLLSVDVFHKAGTTNARTWGRGCVIGIATMALLAALQRYEAIFNISVYAFSGFTLLIPILLAGFFWRRSTAVAIVIGSLVAHLMLLVFYLPRDWQRSLPFEVPRLGVFPVALCLIVEMVVIVLVSLVTRAPSPGIVQRFNDPFGPPDPIGVTE